MVSGCVEVEEQNPEAAAEAARQAGGQLRPCRRSGGLAAGLQAEITASPQDRRARA